MSIRPGLGLQTSCVFLISYNSHNSPLSKDSSYHHLIDLLSIIILRHRIQDCTFEDSRVIPVHLSMAGRSGNIAPGNTGEAMVSDTDILPAVGSELVRGLDTYINA